MVGVRKIDGLIAFPLHFTSAIMFNPVDYDWAPGTTVADRRTTTHNKSISAGRTILAVAVGMEGDRIHAVGGWCKGTKTPILRLIRRTVPGNLPICLCLATCVIGAALVGLREIDGLIALPLHFTSAIMFNTVNHDWAPGTTVAGRRTINNKSISTCRTFLSVAAGI